MSEQLCYKRHDDNYDCESCTHSPCIRAPTECRYGKYQHNNTQLYVFALFIMPVLLNIPGMDCNTPQENKKHKIISIKSIIINTSWIANKKIYMKGYYNIKR